MVRRLASLNFKPEDQKTSCLKCMSKVPVHMALCRAKHHLTFKIFRRVSLDRFVTPRKAAELTLEVTFS